LDEEWEMLVHEVYQDIKDDPTIDVDSLNKLKAEVEKYPRNKVSLSPPPPPPPPPIDFK
jgi:hypothetical protein